MYLSKLTEIYLSISCPPLSSVLNAIQWCSPDALSYPGRGRRTNKLCVLTAQPQQENSLYILPFFNIKAVKTQTLSYFCDFFCQFFYREASLKGWNIHSTFPLTHWLSVLHAVSQDVVQDFTPWPCFVFSVLRLFSVHCCWKLHAK